MFFWNSLAFSMTQWILAILSLVPLPFIKPAWTSGSSRFTYCWSLAWRILSLTLLEELYKKDLHDGDNHDGVSTHLELDILECEVKWALESITMNKASGGDGIPVELLQILKDDALKVLHSDQIRSDQSLSRVWLFAIPWITACQASLSIIIYGVHSDSRPLSQWCILAISSSVVPFSSCPQSLPAWVFSK